MTRTLPLSSTHSGGSQRIERLQLPFTPAAPLDLLWTRSLLRGKADDGWGCQELNSSLSFSQISLLTRPCRWKARGGSTTTWAPTRSGTTCWGWGHGARVWSAWRWSSWPGARTAFCCTSKRAATSPPWRWDHSWCPVCFDRAASLFLPFFHYSFCFLYEILGL